MKNLNLFLCGLSMLFLTVELSAQQADKHLPVDPKVRYGKLDNGLTYYLRHNEQPKDRADFYIAQRVGSVLEDDSQAGLAHFLEHMAFNGTTNFPGKQMSDYLESVGIRFGENLNAYTGLDETVYLITNAPVTRQGIIDSCLLVLHDWSNAISLEADQIEKERGVIREEWRTVNQATLRMWKQQLPSMFPGSQYANRLPIGDINVINNFKHDELRNYYKKWYRPDLQAIIIVGDIDVDKMEAQLKKVFADVPKPVNPAERIMYPVPDNDSPLVSIAKDKEATNTDIYIFYKHNPLPAELRGTMQGMVLDYIRRVSSSMIGNRFYELSQKPDAPFMSAYAYDGPYFVAKTKDAWNVVGSAKEGKTLDALKALVRETEKVNQFGFTPSEYERAKADLLKQYESAYKERDKQKNSNYVNEYVNHFIDGGYIPGIETEYELIKQVADGIKVEDVNKYIQSIIGDKNIVISLTGPDKEGLVYPTEEELLATFNEAKGEKVEAYEETVSADPLVEELPAPGKIVSTKQNKQLGTTELVLSNGIKVALKHTDFKKDQILMTATSPGGTSLIGDNDIPNIKIINSAINLGGVGKFSQTDLGKKLAGKQANVYVSMGPDCEKVEGSASPEDLETMFQLIYLYFTQPRMDEDAFASFEERLENQLKNLHMNPMSAFSDSVSYNTYKGNPRMTRIQTADLDKIDYARIMELYKERYADASDFLFSFVGNIDMDSIKPLIEQYLATLPTLERNDAKGNESVYPRIEKGKTMKRFSRTMETPKASIVAIYSGKMDYTPENMVLLTALKQIMDIVYVEKVREDEGGTYGVRVSSNLYPFPKGQATLETFFNTDPEKADRMNTIVRDELQRIAKEGPRAEDFNKTKENMQKKYAENIQENSYWLGILDDYYFHGLNRETPQKEILDKMTPDKIKAVAKALLSQGNVVEIFMEPEAK